MELVADGNFWIDLKSLRPIAIAIVDLLLFTIVVIGPWVTY
jgi:hypothetical protein